MSQNNHDRKDERTSAEWWENFKKLLDDQNEWPTEYLFKFIVPKAGRASMKELFGDQEIIVRASTRGNYLSITARRIVQSADEVIDVYEQAGRIDGVISL